MVLDYRMLEPHKNAYWNRLSDEQPVQHHLGSCLWILFQPLLQRLNQPLSKQLAPENVPMGLGRWGPDPALVLLPGSSSCFCALSRCSKGPITDCHYQSLQNAQLIHPRLAFSKSWRTTTVFSDFSLTNRLLQSSLSKITSPLESRSPTSSAAASK